MTIAVGCRLAHDFEEHPYLAEVGITLAAATDARPRTG